MLTIIFPTFISPVAFSVGSLDIRWYSLAYIFGAIVGYLYIKKLNSKANIISKKESKIFFDDLLFYTILGVIIGGRLGYVLFYGYSYYSHNLLRIFAIWEGGMSFHGGLIGVFVSTYLFAKKYRKNFFQITDMLAVATPIGLFVGRLANFANGELYGKPTDVPWAVLFPNVFYQRHPSQIYEALLEGLLLFLILFFLWHRGYYKRSGLISSYGLILYGTFRFFVEFFRQGEIYFFDSISMGQVLCIVMIIGGLFIALWSGSYSKQIK